MPDKKRRVSSAEEALAPFCLYSAEAEKNVLGCMLVQPGEVVDEVLPLLKAEDFFVPAHQEIFDAIRGMVANKVPVEVMALHQWLSDRAMAEQVGSPGLLAELMNSFGSHLTVMHYVGIVLEKSQLRALSEKCKAILHDITENADDVKGIIDRAEKSIIEVAEPDKLPSIRDAVALASAFEDHIGKIQRGEILGAVKTHYASFDRINGGLKPKGYHVFGARSGVGKTTAIQNLSTNLCQNNTGVGIITLEMDRIEYMTGIYAFLADINSRAFRAKLTEEQLGNMAWATERVKKWNLQVDDCSLVDVHRLRRVCRRMVRDGASVLFIDYLQLLESDSDNAKATRADQVSAMSRAIKILCGELNVPIVVGAQLNRQAANDEPSLHHLRESGAVEQDADVIILMRLKDPKDKADKPIVCWNFAKWRGGRAAGLDLEFLFDKSRNRFHETTSTVPTT